MFEPRLVFVPLPNFGFSPRNSFTVFEQSLCRVTLTTTGPLGAGAEAGVASGIAPDAGIGSLDDAPPDDEDGCAAPRFIGIMQPPATKPSSRVPGRIEEIRSCRLMPLR